MTSQSLIMLIVIFTSKCGACMSSHIAHLSIQSAHARNNKHTISSSVQNNTYVLSMCPQLQFEIGTNTRKRVNIYKSTDVPDMSLRIADLENDMSTRVCVLRQRASE